jgi:hypothetical protein
MLLGCRLPSPRGPARGILGPQWPGPVGGLGPRLRRHHRFLRYHQPGSHPTPNTPHPRTARSGTTGSRAVLAARTASRSLRGRSIARPVEPQRRHPNTGAAASRRCLGRGRVPAAVASLPPPWRWGALIPLAIGTEPPRRTRISHRHPSRARSSLRLQPATAPRQPGESPRAGHQREHDRGANKPQATSTAIAGPGPQGYAPGKWKTWYVPIPLWPRAAITALRVGVALGRLEPQAERAGLLAGSAGAFMSWYARYRRKGTPVVVCGGRRRSPQTRRASTSASRWLDASEPWPFPA